MVIKANMPKSSENQPPIVISTEKQLEAALINTLRSSEPVLLTTADGLDKAWEIALLLAPILQVDPKSITLEQLRPYLNLPDSTPSEK